MKRKRRIEKVAMSTKVRPKVSIRISNRFHDRANLKILIKRKPLRPVIMLLESELSFYSSLSMRNYAKNMSTSPEITTRQSKRLNMDMKKCLKPMAKSLIIISTVKMTVKKMLIFSMIRVSLGSSG